MQFYVLRAEFHDGMWTHPCTLWAASMTEAIDKASGFISFIEAQQFTIRRRPNSEAATFYRHPEDQHDKVIEHPDVQWMPETDSNSLAE